MLVKEGIEIQRKKMEVMIAHRVGKLVNEPLECEVGKR
jgi:hypothetical protein